METDTKLLGNVFGEIGGERVEMISSQTVTTTLADSDLPVREIDKSTPILSVDLAIKNGLGRFDAVESSQRDIYPHAFDDTSERGAAWFELKSALESLEKCADAYAETDIAGAAFRLKEAAVAFKAARARLGSGDPLSSLVAYLRRALLTAEVHDITRGALESAKSVTRSILNGPIISLSDAADYSDLLEENGWNGDEPIVSNLMGGLLFDEAQLEQQSQMHGAE